MKFIKWIIVFSLVLLSLVFISSQASAADSPTNPPTSAEVYQTQATCTDGFQERYGHEEFRFDEATQTWVSIGMEWSEWWADRLLTDQEKLKLGCPNPIDPPWVADGSFSTCHRLGYYGFSPETDVRYVASGAKDSWVKHNVRYFSFRDGRHTVRAYPRRGQFIKKEPGWTTHSDGSVSIKVQVEDNGNHCSVKHKRTR